MRSEFPGDAAGDGDRVEVARAAENDPAVRDRGEPEDARLLGRERSDRKDE
jgi:hypothetical protein